MTGKMRAVRLFAPGDVRCVEADIPKITRDNEVILKVKSCGICGSDIPRVMEKGAYRYPITVGHEFAGQIVEIGANVSSFEAGDRVTVMPLIACGKCRFCLIGEHVTCDSYDYYGSRIDGAMAEYIKVSANNCMKLPLGVDYEMGSMTDPAAIAFRAVRKANVEAGQTVVVFGLGAIGFLALQWLKIKGCSKVIVVDVFDEKLKLAERLGADVCINAKKQNAAEVVKKATDDKGADAAIEIVGSKVTQVQAIQVVRKLGTVVYCGISYDDLVIPNLELGKILRGEINIRGAWNSSISPLPVSEWEASLGFMNSGKLKLNPLISHRFKLEECQTAFKMVYNRTEVFTKVLFKPED